MMSYAPWIVDGVILIILIVFAVRGAKRGLVLSLCSLVAVFIAFGGATVAARELSPRVSAAIQPRIEQMILNQVDDLALQAPDATPAPSPTPMPEVPAGGDSTPLNTVLNAIRDLGIYEGVVDSIDASVRETLQQAATSAAGAVALELASAIAYLVIFILAFIVILILWKLLSHLLDLVARLPVLHSLNGAGGAILGLVKGCILLFVIAWALRFSGTLIPNEIAGETVLLKFFLTTNPLSLIAGF